MGQKYDVVGVILAPAGAAYSTAGCSGCIFLLLVIGVAISMCIGMLISPYQETQYNNRQATLYAKHAEVINNPNKYLKVVAKGMQNDLEVYEVTNLAKLTIALKVPNLREFNPPRTHGCAVEHTTMAYKYHIDSGQKVDLYCYLWHNTAPDCFDASWRDNKCDLVVFQYDNPDYPPGYLKLP